jgi:uncharacterized protein YjbI with pentapeptide repeats
VKQITTHILASFLLAAASGGALAGDDHPHRTITISGQCHSCDLARENLYGAQIVGASLIEANFDDTNLNHAVIVESRFIGSSLTRADFATSRLSGVMFQESDMQDSVFVNMHGERLRFDGSNLTGADLSGALMILANFMETDLTGTTFANARLFNSRFDGATMNEADFSHARMPGVLLRGAEGENVIFTRANLRGADLSGARFVRADFSGANLQGARLAGTVLIEVEGLTAEALRDACRTASSELPDGIELNDCHDRPEDNVRRPERSSLRVWVTTGGEDGVTILPNGGGTVLVEEIREEQRRAIAEFELRREALAETRRALAAAESRLRDSGLEREQFEELEAEIAEELRDVEEIELELRDQQAELMERVRGNPEELQTVERMGERLIFSEYPGRQVMIEGNPSIVVDGNRYRLSGRYEWVYDLPVEDRLGPKGPGSPEAPPAPDPVQNN